MAYVLDAEKPEQALELLIKAADEDPGYNEVQLPDGRVLQVLSVDDLLFDKKIEIFGTNFHTCMRKCMDSKASSIIHNAVSLLSRDMWYQFIKNCLGKKLTLEICRDALHTKNRNAEVILFEIGLEMLNEQEWKVLNEYTYEVLKIVKNKKMRG